MLKSALDRCPVFLCLLSKAALKSKYVVAEIKSALERKNSEEENYLLIPLCFNIELDDIPKELRDIQCVNVSDGDHLVDSFQALRFTIENFLIGFNL
jgi:hypothetical protein